MAQIVLDEVDKLYPGGVKGIDGLSLIGGNAHTDREYAEVDSMVPRLYLLTRMVMELGRKP